MIELPLLARSRITRSASAPSGTFSTKLVLTLSPNFASTAFRPMSWAKVHPPSPGGPTYTHAIFNGSAAMALPAVDAKQMIAARAAHADFHCLILSLSGCGAKERDA